MRRGALIVNPFASRVTEEALAAVERELGSRWELETLRTARRGHATELAREVEPAVDAIFVFSGDGGYNEVLNGVSGRVPIGLVPGGGASVLPRALGLPRDAVAAARRIAGGVPRTISLGRVNGRRFAFSAGLGLDADIVRRVDALGRAPGGRRVGNLAFALTALRIVAERRATIRPELELEGLGRAAFALVANGTPYTYAGPLPLNLAPLARFDVGLDVVAPRELRPSLLPRFAAYALSGRGQERSRHVLYGHDLDELSIACAHPVALQVDGEDLGDVTTAAFEAERGAVQIIT